MSSKITVELYCDKCGTDSMVTYDPDNTVDEPIFCTDSIRYWYSCHNTDVL